MKYKSNLTRKQLNTLPNTTGIPVNCRNAMNQHRARQSQGATYDLDFASATTEFETALKIGLPNYGSGLASFELPRILKAPGNANKLAQTWFLYCSEVLNQHDAKQITKHWKQYTPDQQNDINLQLIDYLHYFENYLHTEFDSVE